MEIVKKTENRLILQESIGCFPIVSVWGLLFGGIPLSLLFLFAAGWGVESLKCQQVTSDSDRVDCTQEKSIFFGMKQLTPQPLPLVAKAEYNYTEMPGNEDCNVFHNHDFNLIFSNGSQQTIFENLLRVNCRKGNPDWIQTQVAKINQFIAEETGTIEIVRDNRFAPSSIGIILFLGVFIVIGLGRVISSLLPISLHLDKSKRQLFWGRTKLCKINTRSYSFSAISSVRLKAETHGDGDLRVYRAEILLKSGEPGFDLGYSSSKSDVLAKANQIATFVGVKLEDISDRSSPSSPSASGVSNQKARDSARQLLDLCKASYSQRHEFIRVDPGDFPLVDIRFYDRTQTLLEKRGFHKLDDIEDVTVTQASGGKNRTFIRVMLHRDRNTLAGIYAMPRPFFVKVFQAIGLISKGDNAIELESEFDDGTFLVTSNLKDLNMSSDVPGIQRQQYPHHTTVDNLMAAHKKALDCLTGQKQPVYLYTYQDVLELQHRMQDIENRHKQRQGYITRDDIRRVAKNNQDQVAEELWAAIEEVKKEDFDEQTD